MDPKLKAISQQQKDSWNKFSPGWKKWDAMTMDFLKPMGDEIIRLLAPQDGQLILDVAAGTGEPGLTIAAMLKNGKVISTDLSEGMIETANEEAQKRGIKNFETKVADVTELPFEDAMFNSISCRMGFMFFPDMKMALQEMIRVLKPGGRIATSVWAGPEKNRWVTSIMGPIKNNIPVDPPIPGAPGLFRCADLNSMSDLFKKAGLRNVHEKEITGQMKTASADEYWQMMTEIAAPIVASLDKTDFSTQQKIKLETISIINNLYPLGDVSFDAGAIVIYGEK